MSDIFEKRIKFNKKLYSKLTNEELRNLEKTRIQDIYQDLSFDEIINAELQIILENLAKENLPDKNKIIKFIENFQNKNDKYIELKEIKKMLTTLQLTQNIKPCFTTEIPDIDENNLYTILENYIKEKSLQKSK